MMAAAQPPDIQRFVVAVVMGIYRLAATHLATLFLQRARDKRPLHCQVGRILGQVGTAPVCLTGFAPERRLARGLRFLRHHISARDRQGCGPMQKRAPSSPLPARQHHWQISRGFTGHLYHMTPLHCKTCRTTHVRLGPWRNLRAWTGKSVPTLHLSRVSAEPSCVCRLTKILEVCITLPNLTLDLLSQALRQSTFAMLRHSPSCRARVRLIFCREVDRRHPSFDSLNE